MKLKIEILSGKSELKTLNNREGQNIGFKQEAYIHLESSAFPIRFFFRTEKPIQAGIYNLHPEFKVNKYNDLEINPFAFPRLTQDK